MALEIGRYRHVRLLEDGSPTSTTSPRCSIRCGAASAVVAVSGASNVTGRVPDLALWSRLTHEAGAELWSMPRS